MFQFKTSARRRGRARPITTAAMYARPAEDEIQRGGYYQGDWVASKEEWYFIYALLELKVVHEFQVMLLGGRERRGGFVVDFVCHVPMPVAVELQSHWHMGEWGADDHLKDAILKQQFQRVEYAWPPDLVDIEHCKTFIRAKLL